MKIPFYYVIFSLSRGPRCFQRTILYNYFVQQSLKQSLYTTFSCATTARNTYVLPLSTKKRPNRFTEIEILHLTVLTCTMETCRIVIENDHDWFDIVVRTKRSDPVSSSCSDTLREEDPNIITSMGMPPPKTEVPPHVLEKFLSSFGRQRKRKAGSDAVEEENEERCSSGRKKKKKESNHAPH